MKQRIMVDLAEHKLWWSRWRQRSLGEQIEQNNEKDSDELKVYQRFSIPVLAYHSSAHFVCISYHSRCYCVILLYIMLFTQYGIILLKNMVMKVINILINMLSYSNTGCPNVECKSEGLFIEKYWWFPLDYITLWTLGDFQSMRGKQVWCMSHVATLLTAE